MFPNREMAEKCSNLNPDKAYVLGLLHDIGRRYGINYDDYDILPKVKETTFIEVPLWNPSVK